MPPFQPHLCVLILFFFVHFFVCFVCYCTSCTSFFYLYLTARLPLDFVLIRFGENISLGKRERCLGVESKSSCNGWTTIWWTEELYKCVMFAFRRSGAEKLGRICQKENWNVYYELVLRLIWKDCCVDFSVWMLTSLYHVLFCTLTFTYSCGFFVLVFFLLKNFRQVCTCPCGRYVKMNKCWWHALQNVMKKNTCAFCIKLPYLCVCDCFLEQQWKINLTCGSVTLLSRRWTWHFLISLQKKKNLILDSHT